ncbi:MAG: molybdopterin-binding protein, partial [Caulobacteraceae bacterium]
LILAGSMLAAACADEANIEVFRRPRVALIATGDELAPPGQARSTPNTIPESVSFGVAAMAEVWGGEIVHRASAIDDPLLLKAAARAALDAADLVVVTGGASVGERDFAKAMFEGEGLELVFSKAAIKPGKPVWLGRARGKLVLGLPGNPTSALVTARLFLAPLLAGLSGRDPQEALVWTTLPLASALPPTGDRETFVRAALRHGQALPLTDQDSGAQRALAQATLLIRRSAGTLDAGAGEPVEILNF